MRVLFVCLGNICRSPTGEAVFRRAIEEAGLADQVEIDSCGMIAYHAGNPPDARSTEAAARRGYDLTVQRARRIEAGDFERFDLVLAMDDEVLRSLRSEAPDGSRARVLPFLGLDDERRARDVPDPYYGAARGFEDVLDLVENGARELLGHVRARLDSSDG